MASGGGRHRLGPALAPVTGGSLAVVFPFLVVVMRPCLSSFPHLVAPVCLIYPIEGNGCSPPSPSPRPLLLPVLCVTSPIHPRLIYTRQFTFTVPVHLSVTLRKRRQTVTPSSSYRSPSLDYSKSRKGHHCPILAASVVILTPCP
ncbi:hypothetical protein SCLCIDRAFT_329751 [Scleroderma citrinum Foug A]|uniref:Uncharacterized protein n=1 Tax=Scleroderma citrinum Foug A TaxID=1036808 RepID=A0A0C2ZYR0_9AGAM|nr:hypothetical protein SCLCIDRAFT_329751 [Scleroderma citrinum Foug A]